MRTHGIQRAGVRGRWGLGESGVWKELFFSESAFKLSRTAGSFAFGVATVPDVRGTIRQAICVAPLKLGTVEAPHGPPPMICRCWSGPCVWQVSAFQ